MSLRTLQTLVKASPVSEGAGVTVHRTLGTETSRRLDPFLMLDHFSSSDPNDYIAGFPDHPHRGFITFTYMLDGHMLHQDSMGNRGDLRAGGAQWMKAASGVIHSEMPQQSDGLMRGFQLWINLPAAQKMSDPAYQEFSPEAIPEVREAGARIKVLSGAYDGMRGPIVDPYTQMQYLDVSLEADRSFNWTLNTEHTAFIYIFEGSASLGDEALPQHSLAVLSAGDSAVLRAGSQGARAILVAGRPLNEPIVQYGPFVMSSTAEVEQALNDYRHNRLVQKKPSRVGA